MKTIITIFGSSRQRENDPEYQQAYELGKALAREGYAVCNGGFGGTMAASARGAVECGGKTIGVTVNHFGNGPNEWIQEEIKMPDLPSRILKMMELGSAFIVLPGTTGTFLEFAFVWEYVNKQLFPQKPIIAYGSFWDPILSHMNKRLIEEGYRDSAEYLFLVHSTQECIEILKQRLPV
jgi:hypothetical protein